MAWLYQYFVDGTTTENIIKQTINKEIDQKDNPPILFTTMADYEKYAVTPKQNSSAKTPLNNTTDTITDGQSVKNYFETCAIVYANNKQTNKNAVDSNRPDDNTPSTLSSR